MLQRSHVVRNLLQIRSKSNGMDLPKIYYYPGSCLTSIPPLLSCFIKPSAFVTIMGTKVMNFFIRAVNLVMCNHTLYTLSTGLGMKPVHAPNTQRHNFEEPSRHMLSSGMGTWMYYHQTLDTIPPSFQQGGGLRCT